MRTILAAMVLIVAGCSSTQSKTEFEQLPGPVQAAFIARHPYADVQHPKQQSVQDGPDQYILPYTQPDGVQGRAVYSAMGELLDGE